MFQGLVGDVPVVVNTHFFPNFRFFAAFLRFLLNFCSFSNGQKTRKPLLATLFIITTCKRKFFPPKNLFLALRRVSVAIVTTIFLQKKEVRWEPNYSFPDIRVFTMKNIVLENYQSLWKIYSTFSLSLFSSSNKLF